MEERNRRGTLAAMLALPIGMAAAAEASAAAPRGKGSGMDMAQRLDIIESKQAITELLYAYARANDRADEALLRSLFWPESTHKHGKFEGKSSDFVGFAFKIVSTLKYACHHITNVSVEVKGTRLFPNAIILRSIGATARKAGARRMSSSRAAISTIWSGGTGCGRSSVAGACPTIHRRPNRRRRLMPTGRRDSIARNIRATIITRCASSFWGTDPCGR